MNQNELMHYGVLGMKWVVHRYQGYDGSYTKKRVQRYKKAEEKYTSAKTRLKNAKTSGNKQSIRTAKRDARLSKAEMKNHTSA